jgi:hypothetical protein
MDRETDQDLLSVLGLMRAALCGAREECSVGVCDLLAGAAALLERAIGVESLADEQSVEPTLVS